MSSVYSVNKGVNRPVEFKGLTAQYIWWLGGGIVTLMLLFALMYMAGLAITPCVVIVVAGGVSLFWWVYRLSNRYGEHGLMKARARKAVPSHVRGMTDRKLGSLIQKNVLK